MKTKALKADIAAKKQDELMTFVRTERETLRTGRFQNAGVGRASSNARATRKNIARALTALRAHANA